MLLIIIRYTYILLNNFAKLSLYPHQIKRHIRYDELTPQRNGTATN